MRPGFSYVTDFLAGHFDPPGPREPVGPVITADAAEHFALPRDRTVLLGSHVDV